MSNGELADQATVENTRKLLSDSWNISDRAGAALVLEQLLTSARAGGSAWDYSRAMSNLGYYYLAGYYVETEALDRGLEIAKEIQALYSSWDAFAESYLAGYASWSGDSSESRRQIYESLKQSSWNPYALDWNLPLEKNW